MVKIETEVDKETKKRIDRVHDEFCFEPKIKTFTNDMNYDEIIILRNIRFASLCSHHMLQFSGVGFLGYIPGSKGVIGASKLARVVEYFLNPTKPTIQERATVQIADYLEKKLKPKGVMLVVIGRHSCISSRGVKQRDAEFITSAVRGYFKTHKDSRDEFLKLISLGGE